MHTYTNDLIHETSPYLLQHAHNPINWKAWNTKTLELAKKNNKLIVISIGYSACHWCHVMERESFEDKEVASLMNTNFINIKVDREERPDVDQVYMNAVQLMTGHGGWPLNVITLPDGRPIWGGTYFKKEDWLNALNQISKLYNENPEKLHEYADKLTKGINSLDIVPLNSNKPEFKQPFLIDVINNWAQHFDIEKGGSNQTPKFMMPNNYHFLLRYAYQNDDDELKEHVNLTLTKMAYGGIYDHIGGGFARYSVDDKWHIPHFEKMLYDNAQLVSLYSDAYLVTKNDLYKSIVMETLQFVENELTSSEGVFYSSMDADSLDSNNHLEEGAYYVWTEEELKAYLKNDFSFFKEYYNINSYGYWEYDNYVLIKNTSDTDFCNANNITLEELQNKKNSWKQTLLTERQKREKPRLDDKTLTSWNALMLKAYVDAYRVFGNISFLNSATKNGNFILNKQLKDDGRLWHNYKDGKSTINGYLEDYAITIDAFLALYQNTLDIKWLQSAKALTDYTFDHFFNEQNKLFYFNSNLDDSLVSRPIEYRDNVIPSSNSIMAKNLFKLSHYYDNNYYLETSITMLNTIKPDILNFGTTYSNWLDLMMNFSNNYYEVAIVGDNAKQKIKELSAHYLPNILIVGSEIASDLPLLKNRYIDNETYIYVCQNKACKLPVTSVDESLKLIIN